jgi:hypothetical protein
MIRDPRRDPTPHDLVRKQVKIGGRLSTVDRLVRSLVEKDVLFSVDDNLSSVNSVSLKGWRDWCKKDTVIVRYGQE